MREREHMETQLSSHPPSTSISGSFTDWKMLCSNFVIFPAIQTLGKEKVATVRSAGRSEVKNGDVTAIGEVLDSGNCPRGNELDRGAGKELVYDSRSRRAAIGHRNRHVRRSGSTALEYVLHRQLQLPFPIL